MSATNPKVTIHMVASLDGFIAKRDGDVAWLETSDTYDKGVSGEEPEESPEAIDCFVIGARTYELALELGWPYGDTPTYVLTHRELPANRASIRFCSGNLKRLVDDELKPQYANIWLVGGASLVRDFLRENLADEICYTIAPVMIGDGLPFFDHVGEENALHLKDVTAYKSGIVELRYEVKRG